jgi:glycine/D-amino acid oxidase-like deaminating enzyme
MATPDVVVVGGGPAGSVVSTLLADAGHRVTVLERERFPRYHIGESLLSATLPILDTIGATPLVERHGFLRKPGGTFQWGRQREPWSFWFREDPGGRPTLPGAELTLLLDNAWDTAPMREEHAVTSSIRPARLLWCARAREARSSFLAALRRRRERVTALVGRTGISVATTSSSRTWQCSATSAEPNGCPASSPTTSFRGVCGRLVLHIPLHDDT